MDVLYESEIKGNLPTEALGNREREGWVIPGSGDDQSIALIGVEEPPSEDVLGYVHTLVEGVQLHHADIDSLIASYADRWAIERMPVIDRNLIRIALFELLWGEDIPVAVAINEAVELAKAFSTEDSGRFVNGLLGRIAERERE